MPLIWIDGKQVEGTVSEFVAQLRDFAGYADQKFAVQSDFTAHLGEQLRCAAGLIEALQPST